MKKLLFASLFFFTLGIALVEAQEKVVTGTVVDDRGDPLPGASIQVKGTTHGVTTDFDGNFSIRVAGQNPILAISFVGYFTKEVEVAGKDRINVQLEPDAEQLDEVVVTALGIKKEKRALGYAVQSVKGPEVAQRQETNVFDALKGRVSGVQISNNDSGVGGTTRIVIRGGNNISKDRSDQPLIVVDGVPIENDAQEISGGGRDWGSGINAINPDDIESMQVLKGANAAALYGSRAANGVILITTKKGESANGLGVTYSYSSRMEHIYRTRDVQNEYGVGYSYWEADGFPINDDGNKAIPNVNFWGSGASWGPKLDGTLIEWYDGEMRPWNPQPHNLRDPYQTGHTNLHTVALSGANDRGSFRASFSDLKSEGIQPNAHFDRLNISLNTSYAINDRVNANFTMNYSRIDHLNARLMGDNDKAYGKALLYNWARSEKVKLRLDNYKNQDGSLSTDYDEGRGGDLLWDLLETRETNTTDRYIGSLTFTIKLTDWLDLMLRSGVDNSVRRFTFKRPPKSTDDLRYAAYRTALDKGDIQNHEFLFTATKDINEDLNITANAGGSLFYDTRYALTSAPYGSFINPGLYTVHNTRERRNPGETFYDKKIRSLYGTLDFGYKNYLFLQLTGRNDWSSTLPRGINSYFYPSASSSFVFTDAFDLSSGLSWLSSGKVRASWALASTDDRPFQILPTYESGEWFGYPYSSVRNVVPPTDLKPQKTYAFETGLDLGFLDDRTYLTFNYYQKKSVDQILQGPIPSSSGYDSKKFNSGSISNSGIELTVNAFPIVSDNLKWETVFNYSKNWNKVNELDDEGGVEIYNLDGIWGGNGPSIVAEKGKPYGTIMGWDFIYDKETGKKLIDADGLPYSTVTRVPLGNITPKWLGGMINTFSYRNFTLNTILDAKIGGDMWFGSKGTSDGFGQSPASLYGRTAETGGMNWTDGDGNSRNDGLVIDGVSSDQPIYNEDTESYSYTTSGANTTVIPARWYWAVQSSGWGAGSPTTNAIYENSWVRLTELSLAYNLPKSIVSKIHLQNLSLSVFARNLAYLYKTAPDNINPSGGLNPGKVRGIEFGSSPITRQFGFGLKTSF